MNKWDFQTKFPGFSKEDTQTEVANRILKQNMKYIQTQEKSIMITFLALRLKIMIPINRVESHITFSLYKGHLG